VVWEVDVDVVVSQDGDFLIVSSLVHYAIVPARSFFGVVVFQADVELVGWEEGDVGLGVGGDVAVVGQGFLVFLQQGRQQFV
jgi:hypothetical protein